MDWYALAEIARRRKNDLRTSMCWEPEMITLPASRKHSFRSTGSQMHLGDLIPPQSMTSCRCCELLGDLTVWKDVIKGTTKRAFRFQMPILTYGYGRNRSSRPGHSR